MSLAGALLLKYVWGTGQCMNMELTGDQIASYDRNGFLVGNMKDKPRRAMISAHIPCGSTLKAQEQSCPTYTSTRFATATCLMITRSIICSGRHQWEKYDPLQPLPRFPGFCNRCPGRICHVRPRCRQVRLPAEGDNQPLDLRVSD